MPGLFPTIARSTSWKVKFMAFFSLKPSASCLKKEVLAATTFGSVIYVPWRQLDLGLADRERRGDGGAYERLILVGYSCGAVIARKIAIVVHGETAGAPFVTDLKGLERTWAGSIERIILVAE